MELRLAICAAALAVSACNTTGQTAIRTEVVEVVRETTAPCPVEKPTRPEAIGPLPTGLAQLAAVLGAKLKEYTSPGGWADKAEAAIDVCIDPTGPE